MARQKEPEEFKVLIVEDDEDTRAMLRFSLSRLGFANVAQAANGQEAIRLLGSTKFGLVICDWNMPKMSGLELLQHVRSLPAGKFLPFIMLTAVNSKERVVEAMKAGVTDYVVKPWTTDILSKKLAPYHQVK